MITLQAVTTVCLTHATANTATATNLTTQKNILAAPTVFGAARFLEQAMSLSR